MDARPSTMRNRMLFVIAAIVLLYAVSAFRGTPPAAIDEVIAINEGR